MDEKNQESLTIDMVQNNQKLLLYIIFNAFVREWIILDKDSPQSIIQDALGVQSGLKTWESGIVLYTKDSKGLSLSEGS